MVNFGDEFFGRKVMIVKFFGLCQDRLTGFAEILVFQIGLSDPVLTFCGLLGMLLIVRSMTSSALELIADSFDHVFLSDCKPLCMVT